SHEVYRNVVQARAYARATAAVQEQTVACSEQHFEEHEQVEQVAGQKSAVQSHHLQLEQRVKIHAGLVPQRERVQQRRKTDTAGKHRHHRREAVDDEDDTEGHGPVAWQV